MKKKVGVNMSTEIKSALADIKTGVDGMVSRQAMVENRLQAIESKSWVRKTAGLVPGASDPAGSILKMAMAQILQREGRPDAFNAAGFTDAEAKLVQEATRKALDTGTSSGGGGYTVPNEWTGSFIELLRPNLTVVQAGATLMEKLNGSPVQVPKQLTSSSVSWIGQNQNITLSDTGLGQVLMTPKTMAIRAQYSNLLGLLSNPNMENIVRRDFLKVCALELDRVALRGLGVSGQPLGLNGTAGIGTYAIGVNGGDLTRQDMLKIAGVVEDQNALGGKLAFIVSPKAKRVLKNERIAQFSGQTIGSYVNPSLSDEGLAGVLGYPVYTTTQIPVNLTKGSSTDCSEVYFGNFEELLIGIWGSIEILATNIGGNAWAQNAIEIRLIQNVDTQVRHGQSFVLCSDARIVNA